MASDSVEDSDTAEASLFRPSRPSSLSASPLPANYEAQEEGAEDLSQARGGAPQSFSTSEGEDEDLDDYEDDRENRFQGPASTWRKYTAEERDLAASLDQQRANDLSVHLYNAHTLKARLRDPKLAAAARPWQSKRSWIKPGEDGKLSWHPDPHWTAWPLPAEDVPRREEAFGVTPFHAEGNGAYRKVESWRPSAILEEELQALMLREAKERFRRRGWVGPNSNSNVSERRIEDQELAAIDSDSSPPETNPSMLPRPVDQLPDILADEDEEAELTRPSVRHILSKLDSLLIGLHKSRVGHRAAPPTLKSRYRSKRTASRPRSRSQAPAKPSSSRGRSQTKRKASVSEGSEVASSADTEGDEDVASTVPSTKKRRLSGQSRHALGQRDWSEVLSIASLVGWDQAVIDRAASRCASLFGEGMAFRTMPETAADRIKDEVVEYGPDIVPAFALDGDVESEESLRDGPAALGAFFCPYEDCARYNKVYAKAWRWREHLRRKHKLSVEQVGELEQRLGYHVIAKSSSGEEEPQVSDPDETVPDRDEASSEGDDSESDSEPDTVGGVHNDGFLRPITAALGRGKDVEARRRRSTNGREASGKRRKIVHEETEEDSGV